METTIIVGFTRKDTEELKLIQKDFILKAFDHLVSMYGDTVAFLQDGMAFKYFNADGANHRVCCDNGVILRETKTDIWEWTEIGKIA